MNPTVQHITLQRLQCSAAKTTVNPVQNYLLLLRQHCLTDATTAVDYASMLGQVHMGEQT